MRDINRFKGCLLGGAVGDALGYPVEFMTAQEIFNRYGSQGITRYQPEDGIALISDDTQMTLFTAVGLLFGSTRGHLRGIGGFGSDYLRFAYIDWLSTQMEDYPLPDDRRRVSWLVNFPAFFSPREPGRTCISALYQGGQGSIENPINNSKGCGGVMRVAPVGLFYCDRTWLPQEEIDRLGAEAAALTHGHELGYLPAAALVHTIHALASGHTSDIKTAITDALDAMEQLYPNAQHLGEFRAVMEKAIALAEENRSDVEAIHEIGGGWVAEETLAIAAYCAVKYPKDFERAIIASVNHDGDSDSTGAVTGNILGAALGADAIPQHYLETLELRDIIEEVAEDLHQDCPMDEYDTNRDPVWLSKYVVVDYDPQKRQELHHRGHTETKMP